MQLAIGTGRTDVPILYSATEATAPIITPQDDDGLKERDPFGLQLTEYILDVGGIGETGLGMRHIFLSRG